MVSGTVEAALYLKKTKQNWQLQMSQELQDPLVLCPLSFHDCAWGMNKLRISKNTDMMPTSLA